MREFKTKIDYVVCYETTSGRQFHDVVYKSGKQILYVDSVYGMSQTVLDFINYATEHGVVKTLDGYNHMKKQSTWYHL